MQLLKHPLFIVSCLIFMLHQVLQWGFKVNLHIVDAYLDNLLVMPILLTFWLAEKRWLFKAGSHYQLSLLEITIATLYVLLVTEWLFPLLSNRFTFDVLDIPITMAGGFIYFLATRPYLQRAKT